MNVLLERLPLSQVRLEISADEEEQKEAVDQAYRRLAREITIPGFRKGKAPRGIIEQFYGRELFVEEANQKLVDELYRKAIEQEEIVPVGPPDLGDIEAEPLVFTITVPVYPEVDPGPYTEVRVESVDAAITDERVSEVLEELRLSQSPWIDPETPRNPKEGDQVTLDLHIMDGEEEFQPMQEDTVFVLGEANLLDELRAAVEGLTVGESTKADITFDKDNDLFAEDDPRLGKTMTYHITLKGMKERDVLPLDDEFAKTYGNAESLAELLEAVQTNLHMERTREARSEVIESILDQISENATLDIPEPMIDDAVEERLARLQQQLAYSGASIEAVLRQSGKSLDEMKEEIRPAAAKDLRRSLIMREISDRENIEVSDEDLEAEIADIASASPREDEMREAYSDNQYLRSALRNDLFDQKMTDLLVSIATEKRGAVLNGFEPATSTESDESDEESASEATESADGAEATEPTSSEEVAVKSEVNSSDIAEGDTLAGSVRGDGTANCPPEKPIKGNTDSMIYHVVEDPSYGATIPEFCFDSTESAESAGFRPVAGKNS